MKVRARQDLQHLGTGLMVLVALVAAVAAVGGMLSPGLRELHRAWWFRALLVCGCVTLSLCGVRTLVEVCAVACGKGVRGRHPPGTVLVAGVRGLTPERVAAGLQAFGYRVRRWDAGDDRVVEGVKGWLGWAGRGLLHCGVALVLMGGAVGELFGRSELLVVGPGGRFAALGGPRASDFIADDIHWAPTAGRAHVRIVTPRGEDAAEARWVEPGEALKWWGREVRLLSIGASPNRFRSARVRAQHADGWGQLLELRTGAPTALRERDSVTAVGYVALDAPTRSLRGRGLHVKVTWGDSVSTIWVTPWEGSGGVAGPWRFILVGVVPEGEATLKVRTAPGDPFVASGLVSFALGVVCSMSRPLRRMWALITSSGSTTLGAHGPLAGRLWHEEVGRLAGTLARAAREGTGECATASGQPDPGRHV